MKYTQKQTTACIVAGSGIDLTALSFSSDLHQNDAPRHDSNAIIWILFMLHDFGRQIQVNSGHKC